MAVRKSQKEMRIEREAEALRKNLEKRKKQVEDREAIKNEQQLLEAMAVQLPEYIAYAKGDGAHPLASREEIIQALKTVEDPEIMINIYDLGLIYSIEQFGNGDIFIEMTVTTPMCPVAGVLPQQAADAIALLKGTGNIEVKIIWEPAWTPERMSNDAKMMFGII